MKRQHLTAFAYMLLGLMSLACSAPDGEIFMGNDVSGSGGSSAGTSEPGGGAGMGSSGKSQGGSASGGSSKGGSSNKAGSSSGGTGSGGSAAAGSPNGGTGSAPWDPCAGKACGDVCQLCDPKDADCVEAGVINRCGPSGECSSGSPACTIPECEGTQQYYALGCDGPSTIAYPVFARGCYDSCADTTPVGNACPDGYTCTLVWHDPSARCAPYGGCIAACGTETTICLQN